MSSTTLPKNICFICYSLDGILSVLERYEYKEYAYILHDKDIDFYGLPKKEHYHFYISFLKQPNKQAVFNLLGSSVYKLVNNRFTCLKYFIHSNDLTKYQYEEKSIFSSIENLSSILVCDSPQDFEVFNLKLILSYIDINKPSFNQVLHYSINNKLYSTFRNNLTIILNYLKKF